GLALPLDPDPVRVVDDVPERRPVLRRLDRGLEGAVALAGERGVLLWGEGGGGGHRVFSFRLARSGLCWPRRVSACSGAGGGGVAPGRSSARSRSRTAMADTERRSAAARSASRSYSPGGIRMGK